MLTRLLKIQLVFGVQFWFSQSPAHSLLFCTSSNIFAGTSDAEHQRQQNTELCMYVLFDRLDKCYRNQCSEKGSIALSLSRIFIGVKLLKDFPLYRPQQQQKISTESFIM